MQPIEKGFQMVYRGKKEGRTGQHCRIVSEYKYSFAICCVEFEDGHRMVASRGKIRTRKEKEKRIA